MRELAVELRAMEDVPTMSIQAAISFRESGTIPRDLGATTVTAISEQAYRNAMTHRRIPTDDVDMNSFDPIQRIVEPSYEARDVLGVGTKRLGVPRLIGPDSILPTMDGEVWRCRDQFGCEWVYKPETDHYFNMVSSPLGEYDSIADGLAHYRFPIFEDSKEAVLKHLRNTAEFPDDRMIVVDRNIAGLTEVAFRIRGYENFFMDLGLDTEGVGVLLDKILEYKLGYWSTIGEFLEERNQRDRIGVVVECDDLGTQSSLLFSPETLRKVVLPRQSMLFSHMKSLFPTAKLFFHSDGAITPIIPDLIEQGVEILNPVQFTAAGMDLSHLKKEFGKDVVFWGGGVDTQSTLPFGTPIQVKDEVQRCIETLAPGGGFVFAAIHNIQAGVPPENFWAMWETVESYT
jgi:uroporphyrinogen decarboxylase